MAKWNDIKSRYEEQNKVWIKIPKNAENYTPEKQETDFIDCECYEFLFEQFTQDQVFEMLTDDSQDNKTKVKNQTRLFLNNIIDWKNVKVEDIMKDGDQELLEFAKEALDGFYSKNFWVLGVTVQQIGYVLQRKKEQVEKQKKT